jgi:ribonuclease HI
MKKYNNNKYSKYNNNNKSKSVYYVVHKGHKTGIYSTWNECKINVDNFEGAIFKKFEDEKQAILFLQNGFGKYTKKVNELNQVNDCNGGNETDKVNQHIEINKPKTKINKLSSLTIDNSENDNIHIYTDGSCIKLKNKMVVAGFGIYIPSKNISVASPLLNQKITNNRAELTAIIDSIKYLDEEDLNKEVKIITDSQYSMYLFHGTGERYEKNGYKQDGKEVPNIDLIKRLLEMKRQYKVDLLKVRAHTGKKDVHSLNNEVADKLANEGALSLIKDKSHNNIFLNDEQSFNEHSFDLNNDPSLHQSLHKKVDSLLLSKFSETSSSNFYIKEKIDKNIQMNELFEFDELTGNIPNNSLKKTKTNLKLNNWFIRSTK